MPCGTYRREQFRSQEEYNAFRDKMLNIMLGEGWREKGLQALMALRPEIRRLSLDDFLHQAVHISRQSPTKLWQVEFMAQATAPRTAVQSAKAPLAIESGKNRQTAENWLRTHLRANVPED